MIDQVQLNFNPSTLFLLNCILGFILFGVSLDLKWQDFKRIYKMPKEVLVGFSGQLLILPLLTAGLIFLIAGIFNVLTAVNYGTKIAVASLISELIFTGMAFTAAYIYKSNNL